MFNGIIYNKGKVYKIEKRKSGLNLFIKSNLKITKNQLGISISCDGVCLTLISLRKKVSEFYLSNETLNKSKFRNIKLGDEINLEMPLSMESFFLQFFLESNCGGEWASKLVENKIANITNIIFFI